MYSELRIVSSPDLKKRSYICFYFHGKRIREFNGNSLNLDIRPNFASTIEARDKLLRKLEFELLKALENDNYPAKITNTQDQTDIVSTEVLLREALNKKLTADLSKFYKRNMRYIHDDFIAFLTVSELEAPIQELKTIRIEEFLSRYKSSGTYYMNKRRDLGVLFSAIGKRLDITLASVKKTDRMKSSATLHEIYTEDQLKEVLNFLKGFNSNLYLCCLITYGCFLRPHEEVRNLTVGHFKNKFTQIHLSGSENKGKRVRVVNVPDYVKDELLRRVMDSSLELNIFSLTSIAYNPSYFNNFWTKARKKMSVQGLIHKNQTIYSFRHTAAVQVYRKTKDVFIVQQLLGHSDMVVTLKYLRGLGELDSEKLKEVMPEL